VTGREPEGRVPREDEDESSGSSLPTGTAQRKPTPGRSSAASQSVSGISSAEGGRFVAGTVLEERYRILGLSARAEWERSTGRTISCSARP
jgi:hypothetical protein